MIDKPIMSALIIAEKIVEEQGDQNWFRDNYTRVREHNNIMDSIEIALKNQDLWKVFQEKYIQA